MQFGPWDLYLLLVEKEFTKVNSIKIKLIRGILRGLNLAEKMINNFFVIIRAKLNKTSSEKITTPNDPSGWEKMYLSKVNPVKEVKSEIVKRLLTLSEQGERMLETGCGSGVLSAELALAGRDVSICDFSQAILDRVKLLFSTTGLDVPEAFCVDLMRTLPFSDNQFDIVWNSGVLEHWTDDELKPIIRELVRCSKRCVISFVPNERSVFYRYGRESAEQHGIAPWGREMPRSSLKSLFEDAGLINVQESSVCVTDATNLIAILDPVSQKKIKKWWDAISDQDPVKENQGYLLLTVGYKKQGNA